MVKKNQSLLEKIFLTLKNKTYKYMTSISENVYICKLYDILDKYNNTYHRCTYILILNQIHILALV